MLLFVFSSAYVLSFSTVLVAGQCTISKCAVSNSGSEEHRVKRLEEQDQKLQTLSSAIDKINKKLDSIFRHMNESILHVAPQDNCPQTNPVVCDCSEIKANGYKLSGVYRIYVVDRKRYDATAYCDMTTENSSWTVFQRREDGSVDFFREWSDYANGFGNPNGEFWMGNEFLHRLTSKKRYKLRFDLEDFDGGKRYAEFSTFNISSAADKFRLTIGSYSGDAGDSFSYHNGQRFSTKDSDNDEMALNCAEDREGAWWYKTCADVNLNGQYLQGTYPSRKAIGIHWNDFRGRCRMSQGALANRIQNLMEPLDT